MIFINCNVETSEIDWYLNLLADIALYPYETGRSISYRHSIAIANDEEMCGAIILLPQIIENTNILFCKLGLKKVALLQIMPITRAEIDIKLKNRYKVLEDKFYPNDKSIKCLAERNRIF